MASTFQHLDLDLCRKILLRTEEVMGSNKSKSPANYEFEGYGPEMIEFNIRKLHDNELIIARERKEKRRGVINCWPKRLYAKGLAFLDAARDEKVWKEALKQLEVRGANPTLKRVKRILLENARGAGSDGNLSAECSGG